MVSDSNRLLESGKSNLTPVLGSRKLLQVLDMRSFLNRVKDTDMVFDMTLLELDSWDLDNYTPEWDNLARGKCNLIPESDNRTERCSLQERCKLELGKCTRFLVYNTGWCMFRQVYCMKERSKLVLNN